MKIVTIIGARPQFIKAAVVSRALGKIPGVQELIVHTGQHYDRNMSDVFFSELGIPEPHWNLGIGSESHALQTGRMMGGIESLLLEQKPDWALIYGDTNSTLAGALAAVKIHIPIAHVEAGLRSFDRSIPEEVNRIVADHLSDLLFAPTEFAVQNLLKEGFERKRFLQTGDVMYDAALYYAKQAAETSTIRAQLGVGRGQYILATIHRPVNTDIRERLLTIVEAFEEVSRQMAIVFPVHPRTRAALEREKLFDRLRQSVKLIEAVGYLDMIELERSAALIVTDSGGVQKEAFFQKVPCRTLKDEMEWPELFELGWNGLIPPLSRPALVAGILSGLGTTGQAAEPYGDGKAGEAIAQALLSWKGVQGK
jgi:UDP-GlcNAc3NAcA epimerase